jgi:hypothetical protein
MEKEIKYEKIEDIVREKNMKDKKIKVDNMYMVI